MLIKIKQYFRGRLTQERLLYPEVYDTDTLAPELVEHLLNYGYADVVYREPVEEFANGEIVLDDVEMGHIVPDSAVSRKRKR